MAHTRIVRTAVLTSAIVLGAAILIGMTGRVFPPGDSLAVIRPLAALLLVPAAIALWALKCRRAALFSLIVSAIAAASVASGFLRAEASSCGGQCLTLYQKNLLSKAWPRYPLADDIILSSAQVVTLQEVSDHNRRFMARLFDHYSFVLSCAFRPQQEVAILTSLTTVAGSEFCLPGGGLAGVQVLLPDGRRIWIVSLHLEWPFPNRQFRQSSQVARRIGQLDGPVIVSGDFNMVPWGGSVRKIRSAAGNEILGRTRNSYKWGSWLLPLPIDNVLVPEGTTGSVETRPFMGSDHLGLLARIKLR
ncbi:endonuclease/exonuclease/phosphatase family protein [Roseibium aggregatum]|uniref:Endonuclease/exonuclease/phosphatase family protein n=1 Tax=Roseibium aggregatum TaxID=187304 RepID=A0A939E9X2_9HYPH|nr:endonuclease/exonuclease/phosphatase family protein [Roseibium aggregatum]MBN9669302.1 endonuclease/exonuclease/phosphatase family protein [Roseibium aggregatum]